jgi:hypothetical protein
LDGDITVQTCWDADRLDLPRVGIQPLPQFLCTEAAKKRVGNSRFSRWPRRAEGGAYA